MSNLLVVIMLLVVVAAYAGLWKIYAKAGEAGWQVLIPIWNVFVLLRIVGRPGWWLLLMLIPFVSIVVAAIVAIDLARSFGKSTGYGIGLLLLSFIFYPMLGFGPDQYQGPAAAAR